MVLQQFIVLTAITSASILTDLDGTPKNNKVKNIMDNVKLVYPKAKKPLPLVWNPGGVANADTSKITHHKNVSAVKKRVT